MRATSRSDAGEKRAVRGRAQARAARQEAKPRGRQPKEPKDPIAESMKTPLGQLKVRVAEELGLVDKVRREGWGGLSAAETGRVGGIMTRILRQERRASTGEGSLGGKG